MQSTQHRAKISLFCAVRECKDWPKWTNIAHITLIHLAYSDFLFLNIILDYLKVQIQRGSEPTSHKRALNGPDDLTSHYAVQVGVCLAQTPNTNDPVVL